MLHHFVLANSHLDASDQILSCDGRELRLAIRTVRSDSRTSLLEESLELGSGEGRMLDVLVHGEVLELLLDRSGCLRLAGEGREEGTEHAVGRRNGLELRRWWRLGGVLRGLHHLSRLLRILLLDRRWHLLELLRRLLLEGGRSSSLVEHLCFDLLEREGSPRSWGRCGRGIVVLGGGSLLGFDFLECPSDGLGRLRVIGRGLTRLLSRVGGLGGGGEARGERSAREEGIGIEGAVGGERGLEVPIRRAGKVKVPSCRGEAVSVRLDELDSSDWTDRPAPFRAVPRRRSRR